MVIDESRRRSTGEPRVRTFSSVAASSRAARRRPTDQARRARLRRADGADRGAGSRHRQGHADGARVARPGRRGKQSTSPHCGIAQGPGSGARPDPYGLRTRLPVHRRDPLPVGEPGRPRRCRRRGAGSRSAANEFAAAGFRADRPGRRLARDSEPRRWAQAHHPDRRRRYRQDAARARGRPLAAAGICRRRVAGRVLGPFRSQPGSRHRCRRGQARAPCRRGFGAARSPGARRPAAVASAGHLRARDQRRGGDGRGYAAGRLSRAHHRHQP